LILDFHTHIFPDRLAHQAVGKLAKKAGIKNYTDGTAASLLESMERAQVTHSVQCSIVVKPGQEQKINAFALSLLERWKRGEKPCIIPFAGVHPRSPDWRRWLGWIKEQGFPGVKLHPNYQQFYIDDPEVRDFYREAFRLGLVLLFHAGYDDGLPVPDYASVERSANVLPLLEEGRVVLAHMGDYTRPEAALRLLAGRGVYLDTSLSLFCTEKDLLGQIFRKHTAERILFATDCPWSDQAAAVKHLREDFGDLFGEADLQKIYWENGAKLLGLEPSLIVDRHGPQA